MKRGRFGGAVEAFGGALPIAHALNTPEYHSSCSSLQ